MAATYTDDLFKDSTMTLPEHLEELRSALLYALVWAAAGSCIGLYFAVWVVDVIKQPLEKELEHFYLTQAVQNVEGELKVLREAGEPTPDQQLVVEMIRKEGLIPSLVKVDPQEVLRGLGGNATWTGPLASLVVEADFSDLRGFSKKLVEEGAKEAPSPGRRVWTLLPEPVKAIVQRISKGEQVSPEERTQVAAAIDGVVRNPDFYQEADFKDVPAGPPLKELLAKRERLQPNEIARANRWLLTDSFPTLVKSSDGSAGMVQFYEWKSIKNDPRTRTRSLNVQELFFIWMKAGILFGIVIASPGIFYHVWSFVAAGLYPHEKNQVHIFLPFSIGLFLGGAALAYFFVFQYVLEFLLAFNSAMNIDPDIRISEWINFALLLPVMFGVSFQLPLVMFFLERIGILSVDHYTANWRVSVMVIWVLAMILTPTGDPVTLCLMAVPLCGLYFLGIYLCLHWPRQRNPFGGKQPQEVFDG